MVLTNLIRLIVNRGEVCSLIPSDLLNVPARFGASPWPTDRASAGESLVTTRIEHSRRRREVAPQHLDIGCWFSLQRLVQKIGGIFTGHKSGRAQDFREQRQVGGHADDGKILQRAPQAIDTGRPVGRPYGWPWR